METADLSSEQKVDALISASAALLEVFAAVDDVFGEDDAFAPGRIHNGLGRIYRAWKSARSQIDSDFDPHRWRHEDGELE